MNSMEEVLCCHTCGLAQKVELPESGARTVAVCPRCGSVVSERKTSSVIPSAALSLAALVLYVPANLYPILRMERYGLYSENTIWEGIAEFMRQGYWFVAVIVFLASIAQPLLKLAALFFLCVTAATGSRRWRRQRTWIYKTIEVIGPWSMLDVFLLAVLVSLVKLGSIATVLPGAGLVAFSLVVVFNMLATQSFDPKMIWEPKA
jgi:paraquat-inducible protein A